MKRNPLRDVAASCLAAMLTVAHPAATQKPATPPRGIPATAIAALQQDLAKAGAAATKTRKRRAYKRVVRTGRTLLEATPKAPQ